MKPSVNTLPVSSAYSARDEKIIEVSANGRGALIAIRDTGDRLLIEVYRADDGVYVNGVKVEES